MKITVEHAEVMAISRVLAALERAETELPQLAAPDGTVAVNIDDLRAFIARYQRMQNTLAMGKRYWIERWYGSDPERGSAICVATDHGGQGAVLAYLGGDEETHRAVSKVVAAHNAALEAKP